MILAAPVDFKDYVSLDTLQSSCQKTRTIPLVIWGKDENVEKYPLLLASFQILYLKG